MIATAGGDGFVGMDASAPPRVTATVGPRPPVPAAGSPPPAAALPATDDLALAWMN